MCVNTNRTSRKTSRTLTFSGSGPKRGTAVNAEGSYGMTGGATGFSFGGKTFENKADAENAAFSKWRSDFTASANSPMSRPDGVGGFGGMGMPSSRRGPPLTFEQAWAQSERARSSNTAALSSWAAIAKRPSVRAAPKSYADIAAMGYTKATNSGWGGSTASPYAIKAGAKLPERVASEAAAQKARPAQKATDPTSAAAAPAPAPASSPAKKRLRIRPGSSPSATASLGKSGINIAN